MYFKSMINYLLRNHQKTFFLKDKFLVYFIY